MSKTVDRVSMLTPLLRSMFVGWSAILSVMVLQTSAWALPQFARKYNVSCMECHAAVPRLNETGYKFRAAGYRMPNEIGKEQVPKFEDYNSLRVQVQTYFKDVIDQQTNTSNILDQVDFVEAAIHPVTGSWGTHLGTGAEFTFLKNGNVEIEQAQARYVFGNGDFFGSARGGVFHGFEGFSAADRPVGLSRPLIQSGQTFRGDTNTLFAATDPSTAGLTSAYWFYDTNITLSLLNRPGTKVSGGEAQLSYLSQDSTRLGDLLFSLSHIYDHKGFGSGVTLYYYHGQSVVPVNTDAFAVVGRGNTYKNNFQRLSLYANYFVTPTLSLIAGAGGGKDQLPSGDSLDSWGYFAGAEYYFEGLPLAVGARFDQFRADTETPGSTSLAAAAFVNWLPLNEFRLVGEYQYLRTGRGVPAPLDQHQVTAQVMFLY